MQNSHLVQQAMAEAGRLAQQEIAAELAAFEASELGEAERLLAVAGLVAAAIARRHAERAAKFLEEVRGLTRPFAGVAAPGEGLSAEATRSDRIAAARRLLDAGFNRAAGRLEAAGIAAERRSAIEAVLLARLLAVHRPHRIRLALLAAAFALAQPDYRPGDPVPELPPEGPASAAGRIAASGRRR